MTVRNESPEFGVYKPPRVQVDDEDESAEMAAWALEGSRRSASPAGSGRLATARLVADLEVAAAKDSSIRELELDELWVADSPTMLDNLDDFQEDFDMSTISLNGSLKKPGPPVAPKPRPTPSSFRAMTMQEASMQAPVSPAMAAAAPPVSPRLLNLDNSFGESSTTMLRTRRESSSDDPEPAASTEPPRRKSLAEVDFQRGKDSLVNATLKRPPTLDQRFKRPKQSAKRPPSREFATMSKPTAAGTLNAGHYDTDF